MINEFVSAVVHLDCATCAQEENQKTILDPYKKHFSHIFLFIKSLSSTISEGKFLRI